MRIYISADIEGITGVSHWNETSSGKPDYSYFRDQMTTEVAAACQGAIQAGAVEILLRDAHGSARNINPALLPRIVRIIRGWSGHPFSMMDCIDSSFDAALFVGYHSRAGSPGAPLAHTLTTALSEIRLNSTPVSEFILNTMTAAYVNVPVVFVAGDELLCQEVHSYQAEIKTVATQRGLGKATISSHPEVSKEAIQAGVAEALQGDLRRYFRPLPKGFKLELDFKEPAVAYRNSFYPGAGLVGDRQVALESENFFDILRALQFLTGDGS